MYLEKIENSGGKLAKYEGCGSFIEKNRKFYESGNFGQLSKVDQKIFRDSTLLLVSECTDERKRIALSRVSTSFWSSPKPSPFVILGSVL